MASSVARQAKRIPLLFIFYLGGGLASAFLFFVGYEIVMFSKSKYIWVIVISILMLMGVISQSVLSLIALDSRDQRVIIWVRILQVPLSITMLSIMAFIAVPIYVVGYDELVLMFTAKPIFILIWFLVGFSLWMILHVLKRLIDGITGALPLEKSRGRERS
jgi:hypothetical protein